MFYLATKFFAAHTLLTLIGLAWAWLVHQPWLAVLLAMLWLGTGAIYSEFRNS
jgi:hypothetical protein